MKLFYYSYYDKIYIALYTSSICPSIKVIFDSLYPNDLAKLSLCLLATSNCYYVISIPNIKKLIHIIARNGTRETTIPDENLGALQQQPYLQSYQNKVPPIHSLPQCPLARLAFPGNQDTKLSQENALITILHRLGSPLVVLKLRIYIPWMV